MSGFIAVQYVLVVYIMAEITELLGIKQGPCQSGSSGNKKPPRGGFLLAC